MENTLPSRGLSRIYPAEFQAWVDMRKRCNNKTDRRYADYGGRGITVCQRWAHNFRNFLIDMGPRPSPRYSLDRIKNGMGYSPTNCVWSTATAQQRNTRRNHLLTYKGETFCISEWAERLGIPKDVIGGRIARGWPAAEALTTPLYGRYKGATTATINGRTQSVGKWAKELGVRIGLVYERMERGWSAEDALTCPARGYKRHK